MQNKTKLRQFCLILDKIFPRPVGQTKRSETRQVLHETLTVTLAAVCLSAYLSASPGSSCQLFWFHNNLNPVNFAKMQNLLFSPHILIF
jgi:hypothetical protein